MMERDLQNLVVQLIKAKHLLGYHTFDSRRSDPGFPDLVIVGGNGVLFRELKTDQGRVSSAQRHWIDSLMQAGQDVDVWRPEDWPGRISSELASLTPAPPPPPPTQAEVRRKLAARGRK